MMRLARIVWVASDLGPCVRSLPRPCKSAQASSNASQIVLAKLKRQRSFDHDAPDMLPVPERTDACDPERTDACDPERTDACDEVGRRPGRFATAARSLGG